MLTRTLVAFLAVVAGCVAVLWYGFSLLPRFELEQPGLLLTKATFGDGWPLTVDSVRVDCIDAMAAVAYHDGQTYALNGVAKTAGYARIEPLWRWNPENEGYRINIYPLIESALTQCGQ
jgi:hypothetical protein